MKGPDELKKFTAQTVYSISADQVRAVQLDTGFVDALADQYAAKLGAEVRSRGVTRTGDAADSHITIHVPEAAIPAAAQRFLKGGLDVVVTQHWDAPAPDGAHHGFIDVATKPDRGGMRAAFTLKDTALGSARDYQGELKVNIPLVGGMIEGQALKYADQVVSMEAREVEAYLKEQR